MHGNTKLALMSLSPTLSVCEKVKWQSSHEKKVIYTNPTIYIVILKIVLHKMMQTKVNSSLPRHVFRFSIVCYLLNNNRI